MAEELAGTDIDTTLTWLLAEGGESMEAPPGMDQWGRMDMGKVLIRQEFIHKERSAAGEWTLSSSGRRIAQELVDGRKENGWLRRNLVIRGMLIWIDDTRPPQAANFTGELVDAVAVTERETDSALEFLIDHRLVKGLRAYGTLMEPKLTSDGRRVKDHPRLPENVVYQGGAVTNNNSNNVTVSNSTVGAVSAGNNAMLSGNSVSVTDSAAIVAQIQEIQKELSAIQDVPAAVSEALERLKEASSKPHAERSQLKEIFNSFTGSLAAKFGEDPWGGVLKLTAGLSTLLGT
ncbi:hypothetical protein [Paenarthrobacter ureafaciens]|uniref:hypothetical protein n=1 Tax=Paenarthrobacter ureafaciens TaxID=37931 RepID=UPI001C2CBC86|nr:hypothetical protein [Paenarthrobacter ureafaciens]